MRLFIRGGQLRRDIVLLIGNYTVLKAPENFAIAWKHPVSDGKLIDKLQRALMYGLILQWLPGMISQWDNETADKHMKHA